MSDSNEPEWWSVELEVEIDADPEEVWSALTEARRIASWFPPLAEIEPGEGGVLRLAWAPGAWWESRIQRWEPPRHLRLVDEKDSDEGGREVVGAVEYHVQGKGGRTVVRLVHSSFSSTKDDGWADLYHQLENGWHFFLWNLKHYLEVHPGTHRRMISARPAVSGSRSEVWDRVFGPEGLALTGGGAPGEPFRLTVGSQVLEGTTVLSDRPWAFAGRLTTLDDGAVHVEMEGSGDSWHCGLWFSAYGVGDERVRALRDDLDRTVATLFDS